MGNNGPRHQFTHMAEPLNIIFKHTEQHNMVVYPQTQTFDQSKPKLDSYKENEYCAYYCIKGHGMNKCMKLKHLVQNLID